MLFTVGAYFGKLPDEAGKRTISELLPVYRRILKEKWDASIAQVNQVEMGVGRAIAQAFSSKKLHLPELPTFDQMLRSKLPAEARMPDWMRKFEEANNRQSE